MAETAQSLVDKNKEAAGSIACFIWISTGIYYFATTPQASFLSWQSLAFFVFGGFVSALILGAVAYCLYTAHSKVFEHYRRTSLGSARPLAFVAIVSSLILFALDFAIPVTVARWAFHWLYGMVQ